MDEFVANNVDMSDIDFDNMSLGHGNSLDSSGIIGMKMIDMMIISTKEVITGMVTIILSLVKILILLS